VVVQTRVAQLVAREPGERFVILEDLGKVAVADAITAPRTRGGLGVCDGRGKKVLARQPAKLEVPTLARLTPTAKHYLVNAGEVVLAGDEPNAVLVGDLGTVLFPKLASALYSGGGWWRRLR
jgi:hypothetical protein